MDGSEFHSVLPNLTPGVTYEVTIVAVKGERESKPGSESVTTGEHMLFMMDSGQHLNPSLQQRSFQICLQQKTYQFVSERELNNEE